jgi:NAD(P)-dependent dehydrogenase (short-subunit alcohol dehydrogenase family)
MIANKLKYLKPKSFKSFSTLLFQDKVVIVTGGSQGIGRSTCIEFAKEGAKVLLADINTKGSQETVDQIKSQGYEASYIHSDISKEEDCKKITEEAVKRYGQVNVLVNNAAIFILKGFSATKEEWMKSFEVNVIGHAMTTKYAIEELKKQKRSSIVNVSSISAHIAQPDYFVYTTSKAANLQMTRNMALDLSKYGIRVNCVCPGTIRTPAVDNAVKQLGITLADVEEEHKRTTILRRLGNPEEVANGIVFLASEKASYITGTYLMIDGGLTVL